MKPIKFTRHAEQVANERAVLRGWIEQTIRNSDWVEPDPSGAERRFRAIPEHDGRILRVVCVETDNELRVITAFFDRNARRPA